MICIICEKPSVCKEVAYYLDAKWDDWWGCYSDGIQYLVTHSIGHLLTTDFWSMGFKSKRLQYIEPKKLIMTPRDEVKGHLDWVSSILNENSVTEIYNFCDPDTEGERIFWDIYNYSECNKPVKRLWTSDVLSSKLLSKLLANPEPYETYYPYFESSKLRCYTDLVLGFNCINLYSNKINHWGLSLGRCQSPILVEICKRYQEHENFIPTTNYKLKLWINAYNKVPLDYELTVLSDELEPNNTLEIKLPSKVEVEEWDIEDATQAAPELYDKTQLLIDAARYYKINANEASDILQELYQNDKITSYPRTPSHYLDEKSETKSRFYNILTDLGFKGEYKEVAKRGKAIFNNDKMKGHYALIILDGKKAQNYIDKHDDNKAKILSLIKTRMLCRACTPIKYQSKWITFYITKDSYKNYADVKPEHDSFTFNIEGRKLIDDGWLIYNEDKRSDYEFNDWIFNKIKTVGLEKYEWNPSITKPKPIYTTGSIISWMKKVGIGTPATVDSYSPLLESRGYIEIDNKDKLIPTELGLKVYNDIMNLEIGKPEITYKMESILSKIIDDSDSNGFKNNKSKIDSFIKDIYSNLDTLKVTDDVFQLKCPICNSTDISREYMKIQCNNCERLVSRFIKGARLTDFQMEELFKGNSVWISKMTSKNNKYFSSNVYINEEGIHFEF